jgi:nicotinamide-nucleotide amidase
MHINRNLYDGVLRCLSELVIPDSIFNFDQLRLSEEIKLEAVKKGFTVAGAESITGGLVSSYLTSTPGSSDYYLGCVVSYSVSSKVNLLHIDEELIKSRGVVSEEVAREMAASARRIYGSDLAFGVTGYAGPPRGDEERPVGTVCFGFVFGNKNYTWTHFFSGERNEIRELAAKFVLCCLYVLLLNAWEKAE